MKNLKIEIKWALIFVLMGLLWMFIEKLVGLHDTYIDKHATYTNLVAIPAIALYVLALLEKRRKYYNGFMTYKQGFVTGLIITVFVTVLSPIAQYITSTFITPEYFANAISYSVRSGQMAQAEAETYFTLQNYVIIGVMGSFLMGLLTSAIVAIFTRRNPPKNSMV